MDDGTEKRVANAFIGGMWTSLAMMLVVGGIALALAVDHAAAFGISLVVTGCGFGAIAIGMLRRSLGAGTVPQVGRETIVAR